MRKNSSIPTCRNLVFVALMALVALVLATAVQAGKNEVWRTKPFEQWTKSDVEQILYDSPWVKREIVSADWISTSGIQQAPSMSGDSVYSPTANQGVFRQPDGTPAGRAVFVVQWNSSRTLQEALVRQRILEGSVKESEAAQYLKERTGIQIVVEGPDMTPFSAVSQEQLLSKAVLRGKQSKVQITATNVGLQRDDAGYLAAVMFTFPRSNPNGKDIFSPTETAVDFTVKIKNLDLGASFDLRKMADMKGPDF